MFEIKTAAENAIIIYFGDKINADLPSKLQFFALRLKQQFKQIIIDISPSYTTLHIVYDINLISHIDFSQQVEKCLIAQKYKDAKIIPKLIQIPVYYGFDSGLDLQRLIEEKHLSLDEFIHLHSAKKYQVYAIGFSPVFAFLGVVNHKIKAPRLATPRLNIPAGSVGIADNQTAVYPLASSGGWNIIGRTAEDLSLNNPHNIDKFSIGDQVKFCPIEKSQFIKSGGVL